MELGDENFSLVLFEQAPVRRAWHDNRWYYSVIDLIAILVPTSTNPGRYWSDMKRMITDQRFILAVAECKQFGFVAQDGKLRETNCADVETLIPILQSLPAARRRNNQRQLDNLNK